MILYTKNVVQFSRDVPEEKLQELLSRAQVTGKVGKPSFDLRSMVLWPECGRHREAFWNTVTRIISDVAYDANSRKLSFTTKWGPPMFALETLARVFPEVSFTWYNASDDCSIVGYGVAKQGVFTVDAPGAPVPVQICKICHGGCILDGMQYQCEHCPRIRLRNN